MTDSLTKDERALIRDALYCFDFDQNPGVAVDVKSTCDSIRKKFDCLDHEDEAP